MKNKGVIVMLQKWAGRDTLMSDREQDVISETCLSIQSIALADLVGA